MLGISAKLNERLTELATINGVSLDDMLQTLINSHQQTIDSAPETISERQYNDLAHIRYRGLFEQSNDAIFLIDLQGKHIDVNQYAVDLLGYSYEELLTLSVRELVNDDELNETFDIQSMLLNGEKIPVYERTLCHKDGTLIPVEVNVSCIFSDSGKPLYIQAMNRDIRDRKALLESIKYSELRYRTILESMAEGVVIHDKDGGITMANIAAQELLGLTIDQMQGLTPLDTSWHVIKQDGSSFAGEDMPASVSLRDGIAQSGVIMGVHKPDGRLSWLSVTSVPLKDDDGNITDVVVTFTDFTDLFKAQKQSLKVEIERERVNLITDFVQNGSHEFRTPLSLIQTNTYFLKRLHTDNPKTQKRINEIEKQVTRITNLVDTLLLMSKLDSILNIKSTFDVNINLLLSDIVWVLSNQGITHQINLDIDEVAVDLSIPSMSNYLMQGIQAIIDNAILYSDDGTEINITLTQQDNTLRLIIQDEGIGISDEDMPHIFTRFWRKDSAHTHEGIGLGLSVAQRVIELHHGDIHVESDIGKGTRVIIELPIPNS